MPTLHIFYVRCAGPFLKNASNRARNAPEVKQFAKLNAETIPSAWPPLLPRMVATRQNDDFPEILETAMTSIRTSMTDIGYAENTEKSIWQVEGSVLIGGWCYL